MKRLLSELLPYKTSDKIRNEIKRGLFEYELLLSKALDAVVHYENEEYENFDSLVGENGCQTRAFKVAFLAVDNAIDIQNLKQRVLQVKNKVDSLLLESDETLRKMGENLKVIFDLEQLELYFTDDEFFLIKAHLLTITKEYHPKMEIFYSDNGGFYPLKKARSISKKIIRPNSTISTRFADNVSNRAKKLLSEASVRFVQEAALEAQDPTLIRMVSDEYTYIHNAHLSCTPLFWSMKSLFLSAQQKGLPVLLHAKFLRKEENDFSVIEEEYLFIKQNDAGEYYYVEINQITDELKNAACIVQGVVCQNKDLEIVSKEEWKEAIKNHNFLDIVLSNCSVHGQYPVQTQDKVIEDLQISEFETYKKYGDKHGFTSNNPSIFMIQHIYPAIPEKVISLSKN